jgi:hypothetical protein
MPLPDTSRVVPELPRTLRPVVAPLKKPALGLAVGVVGALALFLPAIYHALYDPEGDAVLLVHLLGLNFFPGYKPTIGGALLGLPWGFVAGFAFGFVLAGVRNTLVSVYVFLVGAKERMRANEDVLDNLM